MKKRTIFGIIGGIMLIFAIGFLWYAIQSPTASFPWSNTVTYTIYIVYFLIMLGMFILAVKKKN